MLTSCERPTEARLEGGDRPTFYLSGSGRLGTTIVYGPEEEKIADRDPSDTTYAIWEIEPEKMSEGAGLQVEGLSVTYGVVLPGYKQLKPSSGPPPPLVPGKRYRYWFVTVNAPSASGYFEIRDGKAVKVDGP